MMNFVLACTVLDLDLILDTTVVNILNYLITSSSLMASFPDYYGILKVPKDASTESQRTSGKLTGEIFEVGLNEEKKASTEKFHVSESRL
jgi:hypothetical protein